MTDKDKLEALKGDDGLVFCRVEPKHKRELVKILIDLVLLSNLILIVISCSNDW